MRKLLMIASAAAMAVSMPALAEKGGKGGGGGGHGGGHAAQGHGGGGGKGGGQQARGGGGKGGGHAMRAARVERAPAVRGNGGGRDQQAVRGNGGGGAKAQRQAFRAAKPAKAERQAVREARADRAPRIERGRQDRSFARDTRRNDYRGAGYAAAAAGGAYVAYNAAQSCPPGLAKKGNGCLPPGQANKIYRVGQTIEQPWYGGYNIPDRYSGFYQDTPDYAYRYDDNGYIYRVDNGSNLVSGLIPLLGGGFAVGQPLPAGYDVYNVPYQYRDEYYDTDDYMYRYGDNAIYRADADSGMIDGIVALLAGDMNVGQPLPEGYDVYNVPMDYRDQYYDTDEYDYRYADGNIYQVDTKTQIIQAIVEMIA
ncbi:MAG TPA: hypothetical protein VGB62_10705 [Allosphingosinicella sp.]